jgi:hypothetical protein
MFGVMDATVSNGGRAEWMELLSDHILRSSTTQTWRQLFLGAGRDAISFRQQEQTLLCGLSQDAWDCGDHEALADHFGGRNEHSAGNDILMAFPSPRAALHTAVILQKLDSHLGVRTALTTGVCTIADFTIDGQRRTVTLGPERERAQDLAAGATTGSIALCPHSYGLLEDRLGKDLRDALVVTEMDSTTVLAASVILPPQAASGASTFTGLGRG